MKGWTNKQPPRPDRLRQDPKPGTCPLEPLNVVCVFRLMLPYEEHLRAGGGAEFKIPDVPLPSKPRGIRGRKPLPRGRKPGPKPKDRRTGTLSPAAPPSPVSHTLKGRFIQSRVLLSFLSYFCSFQKLKAQLIKSKLDLILINYNNCY